MNRLAIFVALTALQVPTAAVQPRDLKLETTDLSNGALLSIDVLTPRPNKTFILEEGVDTVENVTVTGNAHISLGDAKADIAYIFVIDSSISTENDDGACGTTLDCVQDFFAALHNETINDGSAKLIGIVDFDSYATITAPLQDPTNPQIIDAIYRSTSGGGTYCAGGLLKAAELVQDPANTAGTTIVVFAGDGECASNPSLEAIDLGSTGAIVHSIAVGDHVDCIKSDSNDLDDIPQNGGQCFSIPDPNSLHTIMDDIVPANLYGSTLKSIEMKVDQGEYEVLSGFELTRDLPDEGAVSVQFRKEIRDLPVGPHKICVRATGEDSDSDEAQVEDCLDIVVQAAPTMSPTLAPTLASNDETLRPKPTNNGVHDSVHFSVPTDEGLEDWQLILVIVAGSLVGVGLIVFLFHLACKTSEKEAVGTTVDDDLKMEETTSKREVV